MRNAESRFAVNPTNIAIQRSKFPRPSRVLTSFNAGDVIPFYCSDVLPGDTFQIDTAKVVRMQTLLTPIFDNIWLDTYFFFCPSRLVWSHFKEFMGEASDQAWMPSVEYTEPQMVSPSVTGFDVGTIADYMGIPTGVPNLSFSALPIRAYATIVDTFFRDQNLSDPLVIPKDETTVTGVNTGSYVTDVAKGGKPFKASKFHDYFTSALPAPQRGPSVEIPIADQGAMPVYALADAHDKVPSGVSNNHTAFQLSNSSATKYLAMTATTGDLFLSDSKPTPGVMPVNLYAINDNPLAATIAQLRSAFQIQKFYETSARSGSKYIELIKGFFGITSPDARLQRPEYLGGNRIPININQVIQNSATDATSPQGNTAAYSLTTDRHSDFTHSFTEHGYIIGVMVARYDHTYQQGLERMWSRKSRFDYYFPVFAHLSERGILNKEIYAQDDSVIGTTGKPENEEVFGYQEAWAEYRYKPSHVTGEMRSSYSQSLDFWHLADDYNALPALSDSWIREDSSNIDRSLAVTSAVSNQFFADIFVKEFATRPMPMYSIPGLVDHF